MNLLPKLQVPHDPEERPPTILISRDVKPIEQQRRTWSKRYTKSDDNFDLILLLQMQYRFSPCGE